jgi:TPR repeat protein
MADFAGDYDAAFAVYHIITEDLSFEYNIIFNHYAARDWYEKAAEFGNINAAKNLVMMYAPDDKKKSLYWLNKVLEMEAEKVENGLLGVAAKESWHKNV